jgi:AcrR family transcriptional regulator
MITPMTGPPGTRDRLMRATREAIRDVGMPATTAREIVGRASANLASIPYHFGTKDALVAEALIAEAHDLVSPVLTLLASDRPAAERATDAVAMLNDLFEASRSQVPVYLAALAAAPHAPGVRSGLGVLWAELRARLADDIARQVGESRLPEWVSPSAMAAVILSLVNGVIVASVIDPDGPDHREVASQFLALLLGARVPAAGGGPAAGPGHAARVSGPDGGAGC